MLPDPSLTLDASDAPCLRDEERFLARLSGKPVPTVEYPWDGVFDVVDIHSLAPTDSGPAEVKLMRKTFVSPLEDYPYLTLLYRLLVTVYPGHYFVDGDTSWVLHSRPGGWMQPVGEGRWSFDDDAPEILGEFWTSAETETCLVDAVSKTWASEWASYVDTAEYVVGVFRETTEWSSRE